MQRREFLGQSLRCSAGVALGGAIGRGLEGLSLPAEAAEVYGPAPPSFSIVPVGGDGKWIWTKPPKKTGYLEQ